VRLLADENCDRLLVAALREAGHDVVYVAEIARGSSDADLMRQAQTEHRAILTDDRDFGLLAEREQENPPTILLLRLYPLDRMARVKRAAEAVSSLGRTPGPELVVIEPAQIRCRPYRQRL